VRARSPRALALRAFNDSRSRGLSGCGAVGEGAVEVEPVGEVDVGFEVQGAGEVDVVLVDGGVAGVDVQPPVFGVSGRVHHVLGELEASDRFGDEAVELCGADLPGDGGDLGVDPPGGFGGEGGAVWMVVSATSRARHAGTCPAWTCAHRRGRRWRSSNEWPMSFFAEVVEIPRTVPSSATQNSATRGHPGPAMGSSCSRPSPPPMVKDAAASMDSGGWRSAQPAARDSWRAAAASSVARAVLIEVRIPDASRSSTSGVLVEERRSEVVVMGTSQAGATDTRSAAERVWISIFEQVSPARSRPWFRLGLVPRPAQPAGATGRPTGGGALVSTRARSSPGSTGGGDGGRWPWFRLGLVPRPAQPAGDLRSPGSVARGGGGGGVALGFDSGSFLARLNRRSAHLPRGPPRRRRTPPCRRGARARPGRRGRPGQ
jgi:hypothetical protein